MRIPEQAKRVFEGEIFDVYQWNQEMYDGSTRTFEMVKRPNTVDVIATCPEGVYIIEEQQPGKEVHSTLFGGRQDPGEDPLECAKRELLEEAGMVSEDWELYQKWDVSPKMEYYVYVYLARNCKQVQDPERDGGEKILIKCLPFDAFIELAYGDFWGPLFSKQMLHLKHHPKELDVFKKRLF